MKTRGWRNRERQKKRCNDFRPGVIPTSSSSFHVMNGLLAGDEANRMKLTFSLQISRETSSRSR